tara:strand:+ start:1890 stop:2801 length:912 start_codon:yes stop_codon:yes gene_type:complete
MKIIITGGAGYIGTELVFKLSRMEIVEEILVYDNLCKGNYNLFTGMRKIENNKVRFIQADILDTRTLKQCLKGYDTLIHLAAKVETPYADQNAHDFEQTNHWGTAEIVYSIEESDINKVIYLSSQTVYGYGHIKDINHSMTPKSFYALSKKRGEEHLIRLMDKVDVLLIRCASVFGYSKNLRFETILNQLLFQAHHANRISIHGLPTSSMTYISVGQLVGAMSNALSGNMPTGIYNMSQFKLTQQEIEEAIKEMYPALETIYVDQHITYEDLNMMCCAKMNTLISDKNDLQDELINLQNQFTF